LNLYRLIPLVLGLLVAAPAGAAPTAAKPLETRLAQALSVPHVSKERSAALAVDLETGEIVYSQNPSLSLAPASTQKLAVTYGLLVRLGPTYRIETQVLGDGGLEGATWHGDLVLKGFGDPTLSDADLRGLARRVRAQGIRRVTGAVVGDESFFDGRRIGPGWKRSYYIEESPPLSALVVDRARYDGRRTAYRPALVAAQLFDRALAAEGVAVAGQAILGTAVETAAVLARTTSAPLGGLLRSVNRESDNFTAEMLLKHLGALEVGKGTTAAGAAAVRAALQEASVPLAGVRVVDGSGLSLDDRLTVEALAAILVAAWQDPLLRGSFLSSLAVAGRNGTLERRLRAPTVVGEVFAKTGTTARASSLAGYVKGRYAFAVLQNGSPVSYWWCRVAQDRFVTELARASRLR
jgi:D-alanyl-D-alanine carboxypeptidase/D-alanyl-D-alanine-endopeptidase (penicillin-binding protein 4)